MVSPRRNGGLDPALFFLVAGAAVLALGYLAAPLDEAPQPEPRTPNVQASLATFEARTGRPPSEAEASALRETLLDTEALVREARTLKLDHDDPIIRGRLAQKRRALARTHADPSEGARQADAPSTAQPAVPRFTFRQVFFSRHAGDDVNAQRVKDAEAALANETSSDTLGDPFIRGNRFAAVDEMRASRIFGPAFAKGLGDLPLNSWSPLESTYGTHLVLLEERTAEIPATQAARDARVDADDRRQEAERALVQRLRDRYVLHRETPTQETP